jgi:hypothetical protein
MTAFRIIKSLTKRGNTVIGAGCYAAAIECKTDSAKVIKIGNNLEDPWLDYYFDIIKKNQHNPCIPKVYSLNADRQYNFYICIMEKLVGWDEHKDHENDAKNLVRSYIQNAISKDEWLDSAVDYPKQFPAMGAMLDVMDKIKENTYVEDIYRRIDLHASNILARTSGQLVITDPWCQLEEDMEDISDVDNWVSDNINLI